IIVFLSTFIAIVIVWLAMPYMVDFAGKQLDLQRFVTWPNLTMFLGSIIIVGLLAGTYPALILSGFNPVLILKGTTRSAKGGVGLRKALVVFQFTLSIALITGTMIVYFQMNQLLDKDL